MNQAFLREDFFVFFEHGSVHLSEGRNECWAQQEGSHV